MASAGWINKIRLLTGAPTARTVTEFDIGTTFDKVRYSEENAATLKDFATIVNNFFKSYMFTKYIKNEPGNRSVIEWYEVIPTDVNPTADETKVATW